jgi:hypothetical protein
MKIYQITIALLFSILVRANAQEIPDLKPITGEYVELKATVKVIGEDGLSITGANVHVRVLNLERYRDGSNDFIGITNEKGEFTVQANTSDSFIPISVKMTGYYPSEIKYQYPYELNKEIKLKEKLQPWNPTIPITLKKIGKGAPMYARAAPRKTVDLPSQDEVHGYDMIEDDWVAPKGKGQVADLCMRAHMDVIDDENFDSNMVITFPNRGDGWIALNELQGIESEMKYPREAPVAGYRDGPINLKFRWRKPHDKQLPEGGNPYGYILRLRTKLNENGEVLSAIYAKIIDSNLYPPIDPRRLENPIYFGSSPKLIKENKLTSGCFFQMHYYLNPKPNDRTLEFDRKTNLATESERSASDLDP